MPMPPRSAQQEQLPVYECKVCGTRRVPCEHVCRLCCRFSKVERVNANGYCQGCVTKFEAAHDQAFERRMRQRRETNSELMFRQEQEATGGFYPGHDYGDNYPPRAGGA